eukprot:g40400.t1
MNTHLSAMKPKRTCRSRENAVPMALLMLLPALVVVVVASTVLILAAALLTCRLLPRTAPKDHTKAVEWYTNAAKAAVAVTFGRRFREKARCIARKQLLRREKRGDPSGHAPIRWSTKYQRQPGVRSRLWQESHHVGFANPIRRTTATTAHAQHTGQEPHHPRMVRNSSRRYWLWECTPEPDTWACTPEPDTWACTPEPDTWAAAPVLI